MVSMLLFYLTLQFVRKDIVHEILEKAVEYLVPGGELWIVIQKKQGAPSALKTRRSIF